MILITGTAPPENYTSGTKRCFGRFSRMQGESSRGRPVWKHDDDDKRFFFVGQYDYWWCGYAYGNNAGGYGYAHQNENGLPDTMTNLPSITLKGKKMTINHLYIGVKMPENANINFFRLSLSYCKETDNRRRDQEDPVNLQNFKAHYSLRLHCSQW